MIGVCRGLWFAAIGHPMAARYRIAPISRAEAERYPYSYPISKRYFQLLDLCPLRMSREDQ